MQLTLDRKMYQIYQNIYGLFKLFSIEMAQKVDKYSCKCKQKTEAFASNIINNIAICQLGPSVAVAKSGNVSEPDMSIIVSAETGGRRALERMGSETQFDARSAPSMALPLLSFTQSELRRCFLQAGPGSVTSVRSPVKTVTM